MSLYTNDNLAEHRIFGSPPPLFKPLEMEVLCGVKSKVSRCVFLCRYPVLLLRCLQDFLKSSKSCHILLFYPLQHPLALGIEGHLGIGETSCGGMREVLMQTLHLLESVPTGMQGDHAIHSNSPGYPKY